ncbi:hypothetical protein NO134_22035 [Ochrobactrum sp. BD22]
MAKGDVTLSDFPVAPRRARATETDHAVAPVKDDTDSSSAAETAVAEITDAPVVEQKPRKDRSAPLSVTPEERRARAVESAIQREDSRNRLRDLRKSRERDSKHFVNVPLDYDTKRRLERAAHDNDLKMTVIMRAAIDEYLTNNGY